MIHQHTTSERDREIAGVRSTAQINGLVRSSDEEFGACVMLVLLLKAHH